MYSNLCKNIYLYILKFYSNWMDLFVYSILFLSYLCVLNVHMYINGFLWIILLIQRHFFLCFHTWTCFMLCKLSLSLSRLSHCQLEDRKMPSGSLKKRRQKYTWELQATGLTSVVGKMVETIIRDKIVCYLEHHSLIRDLQHNLKNKRSCFSNMVTFLQWPLLCSLSH